jgi:hypothetical protein
MEPPSGGKISSVVTELCRMVAPGIFGKERQVNGRLNPNLHAPLSHITPPLLTESPDRQDDQAEWTRHGFSSGCDRHTSAVPLSSSHFPAAACILRCPHKPLPSFVLPCLCLFGRKGNEALGARDYASRNGFVLSTVPKLVPLIDWGLVEFGSAAQSPYGVNFECAP